MVTPVDPDIRAIQEVAAANADAILEARGMTRADLARAMKAGGGPTKKTVYNVLNKTNQPTFKNLAQVAKALGIPLWTLLIPDLRRHRELLEPGALKGLATVVENYLETHPTKRAKIERMAQAMRDDSDLDK